MGARERSSSHEELTLDEERSLAWTESKRELALNFSVRPLSEALARELLAQLAPIEASDVAELALCSLAAARAGCLVALDPQPAIRDSAEFVSKPALRFTRWIGERRSFDAVAFVDGVVSASDLTQLPAGTLVCCRRVEPDAEALALSGRLAAAELETSPETANSLADAAACCGAAVATDASEIAAACVGAQRVGDKLELLNCDPDVVARRRSYVLRLSLAPELLNPRIVSLGGCVVVKLAADQFERVRRAAFQACAAALHAAALHGVAVDEAGAVHEITVSLASSQTARSRS